LERVGGHGADNPNTAANQWPTVRRLLRFDVDINGPAEPAARLYCLRMRAGPTRKLHAVDGHLIQRGLAQEARR
jgi:hypothetical protein